MDKEITNICGNSEIIPDFEMIGNDPTFIFTPDPSFNVIALFDSAGNTINVNSWLECANYVNGGWSTSISAFSNYEEYLFSILSIVSISLIAYEKFFLKRRNQNS
jgi:hypothetical protein